MDGDVAAMRVSKGERIAREKKVAPEVEMRGKDEEAGEGEEARRLEMEQQHLAEDKEVNSAHRSDDELDYSYSSGDDDKSDDEEGSGSDGRAENIKGTDSNGKGSREGSVGDTRGSSGGGITISFLCGVFSRTMKDAAKEKNLEKFAGCSNLNSVLDDLIGPRFTCQDIPKTDSLRSIIDKIYGRNSVGEATHELFLIRKARNAMGYIWGEGKVEYRDSPTIGDAFGDVEEGRPISVGALIFKRNEAIPLACQVNKSIGTRSCYDESREMMRLQGKQKEREDRKKASEDNKKRAAREEKKRASVAGGAQSKRSRHDFGSGRRLHDGATVETTKKTFKSPAITKLLMDHNESEREVQARVNAVVDKSNRRDLFTKSSTSGVVGEGKDSMYVGVFRVRYRDYVETNNIEETVTIISKDDLKELFQDSFLTYTIDQFSLAEQPQLYWSLIYHYRNEDTYEYDDIWDSFCGEMKMSNDGRSSGKQVLARPELLDIRSTVLYHLLECVGDLTAHLCPGEVDEEAPSAASVDLHIVELVKYAVSIMKEDVDQDNSKNPSVASCGGGDEGNEDEDEFDEDEDEFDEDEDEDEDKYPPKLDQAWGHLCAVDKLAEQYEGNAEEELHAALDVEFTAHLILSGIWYYLIDGTSDDTSRGKECVRISIEKAKVRAKNTPDLDTSSKILALAASAIAIRLEEKSSGQLISKWDEEPRAPIMIHALAILQVSKMILYDIGDNNNKLPDVINKERLQKLVWGMPTWCMDV